MQGTASTEGGAHTGRGSSGTSSTGLNVARLADRGVVRVAGPDARQLLQGLVTQDLDLLDTHGAVYAGLLSPQGKILFDFLVLRDGEALLLDVVAARAAELIKRLTLYRLRAKVTFEERADLAVLALWGAGEKPRPPEGGVVAVDPRLPALGYRAIVPADGVATWSGPLWQSASAEAWHAHRVGLGVPDGGRDFAFGDAFPHEADMDQLAGVSFTKGCYVGQEVVSRMQHRGTARKRIVQVTGDAPLQPGAQIMAGAASIGAVASVDGVHALALLRLDRAAEAKAKGESLMAGNTRLAVVKPAWATFDLTPPPREAAHDL